MHYVYVLRREDKDWYIGYTSELENRLKKHQTEHPGYKLAYYEAYITEQAARQRERKLKYYGSAWRALKKRITA